jgi:transposase
MITLGIDAHKRTHTVVAVDHHGRQLGTKTTKATTTADHLAIVRWADQFGVERCWAVEDCRHLSRRLERDMLAAGERIVRVPPKLMAHSRDAARTYGKSDPIDALAVARAALREPGLPTAHLDDTARELRLLVDHREDLVAERTRHINRLRWHLHEIDPTWEPDLRAFTTFKHLDVAADRLAGLDSVIARVAADLVARIRQLTIDINELRSQLETRTEVTAPRLRQIHGIGPLASAKLIGEVAGVQRFRSASTFARHNGTAPTPVWSGNTDRHRLSRAGNRQLNAAIHRVALTQARSHPGAIAFLQRRAERGATRKEAIRSLKRRLSDVIYRAMLADIALHQERPTDGAA